MYVDGHARLANIVAASVGIISAGLHSELRPSLPNDIHASRNPLSVFGLDEAGSWNPAGLGPIRHDIKSADISIAGPSDRYYTSPIHLLSRLTRVAR